MGQFSPSFLGSRWGRNSQNLRSREGFCKKLKGWRGVWGAALAKFLILMLFYVFLHHFLSIFLIFNNFLSFFFLCFPLFFVSFGSLQPCQGGAAAPSAPPRWGSDMPGWGCCPICPPLATPLVYCMQKVDKLTCLRIIKNVVGILLFSFFLYL